MTRFTLKNVFKVAIVLIFLPFIIFLLPIIGLVAKNKKVLLEGVIYAAVFFLAFSVPDESALYTLAAFLGLGAMVTSAVRSYMLRDLWLHRKVGQRHQIASVQPQPTYAAPRPPQPQALPVQSPDDLSSALAWVVSHAKQNKHRLPSETYVTILETCQTLDTVLDAERQQPSGDARFEYEFDAMVRQYLPSVLRSYLAIPPSMVDSRQPNGRTPNQELAEQLQLLSRQAETLHASRYRQTSAELTSTGNFLRERFGHNQQGAFDFGIE